jgi:uncharacterized delta-60 repeat protein
MISKRFSTQFCRACLLFGLALTALLARLTPPTPAQAAFIDPGFNPGASGTVYVIVVQPDGKILVGGGFGNLGGAYRPGIGRLNPDGSLDSSFNPGNAGAAIPVVRAIARQNDGKILAGGSFSSLAGQPRSSLGRLNADGSLDAGFLDPGVRFNANFGTIEAIAIQSDGKIVIGGWFTEVAGQPRQNIARLNANGSLDAAFNPGANGRVNDLAIQPDGKILVGGEMTLLAGQARNYLGRLNADGSLDESYTINPGQVTDRVYAMALQPDGKLIIGGSLGGHVRRMNSDGSMDFSFVGTAGAVVYAIALQTDGKILIGGSFGTVNGRERRFIARLGANGIPDGSFNPGVDLTVLAVAAQADGRVLAGGLFSQMGGVTRSRLGRTNPTAPTPVPDPAFNPTVNNLINTVDLQADGKIILGGTFTEIDGQPRGRVGRLHPDGSLDGGFTIGESNGTVYAVAAQPNGKVIVGGNFTLLDGAARAGIGRLNADGLSTTIRNAHRRQLEMPIPIA